MSPFYLYEQAFKVQVPLSVYNQSNRTTMLIIMEEHHILDAYDNWPFSPDPKWPFSPGAGKNLGYFSAGINPVPAEYDLTGSFL